jgi:GDP-L-fucose synthase
MEGKALISLLKERNYSNITNLEQSEPDLADFSALEAYFNTTHPEYIFLMAGQSGGIKANQEMPATLMLDNLLIDCNVIRIAHNHRVKKLLYVASSCVYPKHTDQPMHPDMLMTGPLEPTNSAYATAKLAGIELCRAYRKEHSDNFISAIPANIFGPGDDFSAGNSHVVAALMRKMHEAKKNGNNTVEIWGTGKPRREFIYVDDLADACLFLMSHYDDEEPINIGSGTALSISRLATIIKKIVGYHGKLLYNNSKPDGMPEKLLDSTELFTLDWGPAFLFENAAKITFDWFNLKFN